MTLLCTARYFIQACSMAIEAVLKSLHVRSCYMELTKFVTILHHSSALTLWQGVMILIEPYPPRVL